MNDRARSSSANHSYQALLSEPVPQSVIIQAERCVSTFSEGRDRCFGHVTKQRSLRAGCSGAAGCIALHAHSVSFVCPNADFGLADFHMIPTAPVSPVSAGYGGGCPAKQAPCISQSPGMVSPNGWQRQRPGRSVLHPLCGALLPPLPHAHRAGPGLPPGAGEWRVEGRGGRVSEGRVQARIKRAGAVRGGGWG